MISLYFWRVNGENKEYFALIQRVNKLVPPNIEAGEGKKNTRSLKQWFSDFGVLEDHLEALLEQRLQDRIPLSSCFSSSGEGG